MVFLNIYLFVCVCLRTACLLVFSSFPCGIWQWLQVVRLSDCCLYQLSHLLALKNNLFFSFLFFFLRRIIKIKTLKVSGFLEEYKSGPAVQRGSFLSKMPWEASRKACVLCGPAGFSIVRGCQQLRDWPYLNFSVRLEACVCTVGLS